MYMYYSTEAYITLNEYYGTCKYILKDHTGILDKRDKSLSHVVEQSILSMCVSYYSVNIMELS